jgi:multidrug efflux system membrane fusion protein
MLKWILPFLVLLLGVGVTVALVKLGPKPEEATIETLVPPVEYMTAKPQRHTLVVESQGTVQAATSSVLLPEVSGRIVWVSPNFDNGRFFEAGEVLMEIDPLLYEGALAEAESRLAAAELRLAQEIAQGEQAAQDWRELGRGEPSELTLRKPQQAMARADIRAAEAALKIARENLARTRVRAPFRGRVQETLADVGQAVTANMTQMARLYGIDFAEVRLPLTLKELDLLGLLGQKQEAFDNAVHLSAEFGTRTQTWPGRLSRIEGTIDPVTRLVHAIASVDDPFGRDGAPDGFVPMNVGLFVAARIEGRTLENVFIFSRQAMVRENEVFVIDAENRLHRRTVEVLKADAEKVVVVDGLEDGDRINLTPIDFFIEGMPVNPQPFGEMPLGDEPATDGENAS